MAKDNKLLGKKKAMVIENKKRLRRLLMPLFDPVTGDHVEVRDPWNNNDLYCRKRVEIPDHIIPVQWLPYETRKNALYKEVMEQGSIENYIRNVLKDEPDDNKIQYIQRSLLEVRYRTDFVCWAYCEWRIKDKKGQDENMHISTIDKADDDDSTEISLNRNGGDSTLVPFKLNKAQLVLLGAFESMRLRGLPIRVIFTKARQCGGSTLTDAYMAWIQLMLKNSWYSVIVAQVSSTAKKIQMMYEKGIGQYSPWLLGLNDGERLRFSQYGRSASDFRITYGSAAKPQNARDTVISVGTYNNPDSLPGSDMAMAHISELALWKATNGKSPEDLFKSVAGGIMNLPLTMIAIESTPRGSGNYFADEYARAKEGNSAYRPLFVSPALNPYDLEEVKNKEGFAGWLMSIKDMKDCPTEIFGCKGKPCRVSGQFIWRMWELGFTFQSILWYLLKHLEFSRHSDMASEAPVDDIEAFANTDSLVFDLYDLDKLEKEGVQKPIKVGDIDSDYTKGKACLDDFKFVERRDGKMRIWEEPNKVKMTNQYIVVVDIGYFWEKADWSVIRVVDRSDMLSGGVEKTVLMWHGHIPHDHLAWKAAQVAKMYNNALLVFESNTYEKERNKENSVVVADDDGNELNYILDILNYSYSNLYCRREKQAEDAGGKGGKMKVGFHTNRKTKPGIVRTLQAMVSNQDYLERDKDTIEELRCYERKADGKYGAMVGRKDDRLMTLGIALYLSRSPQDGIGPVKIKTADKNKKQKHDYHNTHGEASF